MVGQITGQHDTLSHTTLRYLHQSYPLREMIALYLAADVLLVTALRDGMNLVAKEFVAAHQDGRGVLVLSEYTGAADQLTQAVLVNPHDIDGMARTIATAFSMPLMERRMRWEAMMAKLRAGTIQEWFGDFVSALQDAHALNDTAQNDNVPGAAPVVWPVHSVASVAATSRLH